MQGLRAAPDYANGPVQPCAAAAGDGPARGGGARPARRGRPARAGRLRAGVAYAGAGLHASGSARRGGGGGTGGPSVRRRPSCRLSAAGRGAGEAASAGGGGGGARRTRAPAARGAPAVLRAGTRVPGPAGGGIGAVQRADRVPARPEPVRADAGASGAARRMRRERPPARLAAAVRHRVQRGGRCGCRTAVPGPGGGLVRGAAVPRAQPAGPRAADAAGHAARPAGRDRPPGGAAGAPDGAGRSRRRELPPAVADALADPARRRAWRHRSAPHRVRRGRGGVSGGRRARGPVRECLQGLPQPGRTLSQGALRVCRR